MKEPHRYQGRYGSKPDPDRCAASVYHGRSGNFQCSNKRKKGSEWCGTHEPKVAKEDAPRLWIVHQSSYGREGPELVSTPILKETKKQLTIEDGGYSFGYRTRIALINGKPELGARSPVSAAGDFLKSRERDVERARESLAQAERDLEAAQKLMDQVYDKHNPS